MATHGFGILRDFEPEKWYQEYEPERYECILVDDDLIEEMLLTSEEGFSQMEAYACTSLQPIQGLNYCGVTLIPPCSLKTFYALVNQFQAARCHPELDTLLTTITAAMAEGSYLIHFGI